MADSVCFSLTKGSPSLYPAGPTLIGLASSHTPWLSMLCFFRGAPMLHPWLLGLTCLTSSVPPLSTPRPIHPKCYWMACLGNSWLVFQNPLVGPNCKLQTNINIGAASSSLLQTTHTAFWLLFLIYAPWSPSPLLALSRQMSRLAVPVPPYNGQNRTLQLACRERLLPIPAVT